MRYRLIGVLRSVFCVLRFTFCGLGLGFSWILVDWLIVPKIVNILIAIEIEVEN